MLQHYIKTAFRHLLKYKTQNLISILGLSVGILCFSICLYCSRFIYSVDQCFTNKERIANVNLYTPDGDIYPCHQFVGDPAYKLGNVWDGVTNTALRDEFKLCNVYARPDCKDCWARLYCAGGCAANALHATGDIHGVYEYGCEVFRKRIECALMIKVAESLDPELAGRAATAAPATDEDCGDCSSCE